VLGIFHIVRLILLCKLASNGTLSFLFMTKWERIKSVILYSRH
jgi:hypothetical protein